MAEYVINEELLEQIERLQILVKNNVAGLFGGNHGSKTHGSSCEFADYRDYEEGDDVSRIDWNAYARFEKLYLKLYLDERQMHTQIFIDCSASMGKDMPEKAQYTVGVAAALGYLSIHNMDKTSFKLIKGDKTEDSFGTLVGKKAFFDAISSLEELEFDGETDLYRAVTSCPNLGSNDGLTVIISDFFTESDWKKAVDYLCYKKKQVLLIQVMTPDEIDPTYSGRVNLIDAESLGMEDPKNLRIRINRSNQLAYEEALRDMKEELRSFCASRGADFISVSTGNPIEKMLFKELLKVGIIA
jgi:uncharacterized protein (DUF58 family)